MGTYVLVCSHTCATALIEVKGQLFRISSLSIGGLGVPGVILKSSSLSGTHFTNGAVSAIIPPKPFTFSFMVSQVQNQLHTDFIYFRNMQNCLMEHMEALLHSESEAVFYFTLQQLLSHLN